MSSFQTALYKFVVLAGVIGAGCFVVLQVQEGLGDLTADASAATQPSDTDADLQLGGESPLGNSDLGAASTGDDPFNANIPELAASPKSEPTLASKAFPTLAAPLADSESQPFDQPEGELLAQASPASDPFGFGSRPETKPAALPAAEPNPFDAPTGSEPRPIGRASLGTLGAAPSNEPQPLPAVIPRGSVRPLPTTAQPTNGPTIVPAGAFDGPSSNGLAPIPDPFELDLPAVGSPPPRGSVAPAMERNPSAAPPVQNDPFALDLDPVSPAPVGQPIRSASATAEPPARNESPLFDLGPSPAPSNFDMSPRNPPATSDPGPFDLSPIEPPSRNTLPSMSIDQPKPAVGLDFIGDATIDREVPRGTVHPQIQLTKTAPDRAVLGEPMVYEIQLVNTGTSAAKTVVVEDRIPRGTKLLGTIPQAEMPEGSKRLVWRFESLRPGEAKSLRIQVEPVEAGQVGSIATVRFVAEAAAETRIAAPELKFRLLAEQEAALGETVIYKFEIANTGDEDARDVMVRCLVPAGLQGPNREPDLEYPVGSLAAGESKTVDLPLAAIEVGDYTTEATLEAVGVSPIQATSPLRVIKSRIGLNRTGPGKRFVGSKVQFTNSVTNHSSRPLSNIRISETLPPNVTFESASDGGMASVGTVNWTIPALAPGETRDINVTFIPQDAGEKVSTVSATAADNAQTAIRAKMMVVGFSALKVENDRELRPYMVGEQVSMRMTIKNGGTASASAVTAVIRVPDNLRFVKADGPVKYTAAGNAISFQPIPEILNGQDVSIDLVLDCVSAGDAHVDVQLQSSDLEKPILSQEVFVIQGE